MPQLFPSFPYLLLNCLLVGSSIWGLMQLNRKLVLRQYFIPALLIKLGAGIAVGLVYIIQYQNKGDTFSYLTDIQLIDSITQHSFPDYLNFLFQLKSDVYQSIVSQLLNQNPRAIFFSKIASVSFKLSQNYWITTIHFSLFSFTGTWLLANTLATLFHQQKKALLLIFCGLPTLVFWSSGLLKESLLIGCLFLLITWLLEVVFFNQNMRYKTLKLVISILFIYVIFKLKYYYLAAFLPCAGLLLLAEWLDQKLLIRAWKKLLILGFFLLFSTFVASNLHPNLHISRLSQAIVKNNLKMVAETENKNALIHFKELSPTPLSLLKNTPSAIFEGLFRPYIWESGHLFWRIIAVENSLIVLLACYAIIQLVRKGIIIHKKQVNLLIASLLYITSLVLFLPLSAPNLGNLTRYKSGYFPFFILLLWFAITAQPKHTTVHLPDSA